MMEIATPAGRFAAEVYGDGPPLLALHGFPDTASGFAPLAERLAGRRTIAPYLRGYAPSTLDGPHTIAQLADDLVAVADALSPGRPIDVVGHDWGALAVYLACARAPERFARAVTLALPHPAAFQHNLPRHPAQLRRSGYVLRFQLPRAEAALRRRDFGMVMRLWRDWSPGWEPPAGHLAAVKRCLDASLPAPLRYYRTLVRTRLRRAELIRVPTLTLHGARDGCVAPALAEGQERFFTAGYRREILEDVGHFLHLERPAAVAERITSWLA
jgi:pimeloyl-ACP methyl ester carboxylesterase